MNTTYEKVRNVPDIIAIRKAILLAMERRHELVDVIYEAEDEDEAKAKIAVLLNVDSIAAGAILDQSLRQMLPGGRAHIQQLLTQSD
jgi:hypothetical protein